MNINRSLWVAALYLLVLVLLPFSRLAELPMLLLAGTGAYGLIKHWHTLKLQPRFKILSVLFVSYFLLMAFSATDSYWQDKTIKVAIASFRFYFAGIALLVHVKAKHFPLLIKAIAVVALFWTLDAMIQYFVGVDLIGRSSYVDRLNGIFGQYHAKLGPVLALLLPVVMVALSGHNQIIRWLSILLMIIVIILSGTRSAWIMMVFILLAYWFHHVKQRRLFLMLKAMLVATVLVTALWFISPEFQKRIERSMFVFQGSESAIDYALADRLPIWKTSLKMIADHPINGVGAHAFRKAYPQYAENDDVWQKKGGVGMHAHHWILEILAETGIIGLLFMAYAIFKLLLFVRKNYHAYSWAFLVAIVAAFLPLTSTYSLFASFWSLCLWFCGAGFILLSTNRTDAHD
jgi:O-antigen ligase